MHIVELQHKLQENIKNQPRPISKVRIRTAAIDDASKLLKEGYTPCQVLDYLGPAVGLSLSDIESEQVHMKERDERRRKFQLTGELPDQMAHVSIYQR